ncbi:MAG: hypothetical protein ACFE0Q_14040 [Anaerolineae bacterium]
MPNIQVLFQVPPIIEAGLQSGLYERMGGVVRDTQSKQVVMWLQEGGQAASNPNVANGLMGTLLQQTGMSSVTVGAVVGGTLPMINLAVSGYTMYLMIERVHTLEQQIEEMYERISKEFARDRRVEFEAALHNARDIVDSDDLNYKHKAASNAIDQLFKAQQHRLEDFDELLPTTESEQELQQAQMYLLQAMMATTLRTRCYLETDQVSLARRRLSEMFNSYHDRTRQLIRKWLGEHPVMYLHGDISDENLERYLQIEAWYHDIHDIDYLLAQLVREHRHDLWNRDVIKPLNNAFDWWKKRETATKEIPYLSALTQIEALIENYNRLIGFELELATMRLTFSEWDQQVADLYERDDYVVLVDQDILEASDRLSM